MSGLMKLTDYRDYRIDVRIDGTFVTQKGEGDNRVQLQASSLEELKRQIDRVEDNKKKAVTTKLDIPALDEGGTPVRIVSVHAKLGRPIIRDRAGKPGEYKTLFVDTPAMRRLLELRRKLRAVLDELRIPNRAEINDRVFYSGHVGSIDIAEKIEEWQKVAVGARDYAVSEAATIEKRITAALGALAAIDPRP